MILLIDKPTTGTRWEAVQRAALRHAVALKRSKMGAAKWLGLSRETVNRLCKAWAIKSPNVQAKLTFTTILLASTIWCAAAPPALPGMASAQDTAPIATNVPPAITNQPSSLLIAEGRTARFNVGARGALGFQWQKDGVDMAGRVSRSLNFSSVDTSHVATYTCVLTNTYGAVTSNPALLDLKTTAPDSTGLVYANKISGLPEDWWTEGWSRTPRLLPHSFSHDPATGTVQIDWDSPVAQAEFELDWTHDKEGLWYPFHILTWTNTGPGRVSWVSEKWLTNNPGYFRVHQKAPGEMTLRVLTLK